jgi:hypothetical protein
VPGKFPEWPELYHKLLDLMDAQMKLWHGELCEALRKNGETILGSNNRSSVLQERGLSRNDLQYTRFYLLMKRADRVVTAADSVLRDSDRDRIERSLRTTQKFYARFLLRAWGQVLRVEDVQALEWRSVRLEETISKAAARCGGA